MNLRTALTVAAAGAVALASATPATAAAVGPTHTRLKGTISSIDGKYALEVERKNGTYTPVALHQGTIINPTGLTLQPGMKVTVLGVERGGGVAANEIDTPYRFTQAQFAPAPPYPYGAYNGFGPGVYGAPVFGAPAFGYGPGYGGFGY